MRRSVPVAAALATALVMQVGAADAGGLRRARSNGGRLVWVAYRGLSKAIFKPATGEGPG